MFLTIAVSQKRFLQSTTESCNILFGNGRKHMLAILPKVRSVPMHSEHTLVVKNSVFMLLQVEVAFVPNVRCQFLVGVWGHYELPVGSG